MELNRLEQIAQQLRDAQRPVIPMHSGNPHEHGIMFPGDHLSALYLAYFQSQRYAPDPQGVRRARDAVAQYYAGVGATVDPQHVVLTAGTSESFSYLCWLLCEPGDQLLLPAPGYPLFHDIAALHHVESVAYPLRDLGDRWQIDLEALATAITPRTRAIVCVSPHNPTGMVIDAATWTQLAALADQHQLPLIVDEVFAEFTFAGTGCPRAFHAAPSACFTLNGISKMCALPNLKLGWIAAAGTDPRLPAWIERLAHIADAFLTCHEPIQRGLHHVLAAAPAFVRGYREQLAQRRAIALAALQLAPCIHCAAPAGGFYLTARIDSPHWPDDEALACAMLEKTGYYFHPGYLFDCPDGVYLTCSYLTTPDILTAGIQALLEMM